MFFHTGVFFIGNNGFKNEKDKGNKDLDVVVVDDIKIAVVFFYVRPKVEISCVRDQEYNALVLTVQSEGWRGGILTTCVCGQMKES